MNIHNTFEFNDETASQLLPLIMIKMGRPYNQSYKALTDKGKKMYNIEMNKYICNLNPETWREDLKNAFIDLMCDKVFNERFNPEEYVVSPFFGTETNEVIEATVLN